MLQVSKVDGIESHFVSYFQIGRYALELLSQTRMHMIMGVCEQRTCTVFSTYSIFTSDWPSQRFVSSRLGVGAKCVRLAARGCIAAWLSESTGSQRSCNLTHLEHSPASAASSDKKLSSFSCYFLLAPYPDISAI